MNPNYLPIEPFDIERVRFFVHGSNQPMQGLLALFYNLISKATGQRTLSLELVALVDQESAHSMTAMDAMGKYGAKYLKHARELAREQGYLVTSAGWRGIIHPDNLAIVQNAPGWIVWEFPRKQKR
ncbi:hypothetical protein HC928_16750 [bacterium]|nr:hypothetical protein [bacterium]